MSFVLPDEIPWPRVQMAEICQLHYGKALTASKRNPGDVPVYGSNGVTGWHDTQLRQGPSVILGRKGQGPLGVEWCEGSFWVIDTAYFTSFSDVVDPKFFYYYTDLMGLNHLKDGTSNPSLTRDVFGIQDFPLPSIEEQQRIVSVVESLDDKIELNRKTAATLEEMARAFYRSWFVDFDPVHAKAAGRAPAHMDSQTAALFPDSFGEDGLPEGWELKRLGDLIKLNYGKALKKDLRVPGEFPVFGSGGVGGTHKEALIKTPTIIVGRKGTVGSLHWAPNGSWPIDTVFYVTSDYPLSLIMRLLGELPLTEMNTDAAVPGLNRDNAYRLEIPFPGAAIVQAFSKLSDAWQQKIDQLEDENRTLATLRDTLLPRLMSGELRVGEAKERVMEYAE